VNQEPYAPPPAAPGQPTYDTPPPQPPKSKKTLIIILIVLALFLCCCTTGGGIVAFGYLTDQESDTALDEPVVVDLDESIVDADETTETPLDEWYAWEPTVGDLGLDAPTPWQQDMAEKVVANLYPDFTLLESYVDTGGWDEDRQTYIMDYYNVRIALTDDPSVEIADDFSVWSQEGVENGADYTMEGTVEEDQELGVLSDGTEYIFQLSNARVHYGMTTEIRELLITVAEEWPGAAIVSIRSANDGESEIKKVSLTTWDHYYTTESFEGVGAVYTLQDGQWLLDSYHWELPN